MKNLINIQQLVDEWEDYCYMLDAARDNGGDITFNDWLIKVKGYPEDTSL